VTNDSYSMLIKPNKLPMALIAEPDDRAKRPPLLDIESFEDTFGSKARRKRPKLSNYNLKAMVEDIETKEYEIEKDTNIVNEYGEKPEQKDRRLEKG